MTITRLRVRVTSGHYTGMTGQLIVAGPLLALVYLPLWGRYVSVASSSIVPVESEAQHA